MLSEMKSEKTKEELEKRHKAAEERLEHIKREQDRENMR